MPTPRWISALYWAMLVVVVAIAVMTAELPRAP